MTDLRLRLEIQGATQQWVASFMKQHNISAAAMTDALNAVLVNLHSRVIEEYLVSEAQAMQQQTELEEIQNDEANL